jgi:hypothetical protein
MAVAAVVLGVGVLSVFDALDVVSTGSYSRSSCQQTESSNQSHYSWVLLWAYTPYAAPPRPFPPESHQTHPRNHATAQSPAAGCAAAAAGHV